MTAIFRTAVLALSLGLSATAFAQSKAAPSSNPVGRGDNVFFYAPMSQPHANPLGNPLGSATAIGRPMGRGGAAAGAQVTPVPEPGEWAMLLAGLALVGFIVRRNSKRS
jgi:hypothetical protein